MKLRRHPEEKLEIQMTPMIDCVFLLLIFFMVSSTFYRQEADIGFALPGVADQSEAVEIPDEQIIEITADGGVFLNSLQYDSPEDANLPELLKTLIRFKQSADANKVPALLTIAPDNKVKHQRVVDVLNACAAAKIQNVTFTVGEEEM
ncbi:MAG TPA: biopolymer transporter ExbD [Kiritimatiellia bacterium]|nr:biopolymer transporter ExbD [Kiritimatiellia bacterium]HSA19478.1 biopolymer transporter ExbD [Kiritimatiellia bacterium]